MAILTFVLGVLFFVGGFGALAISVDLLPTDMGRLYVESGVIFISAGGVVWAVAALIARLDRIAAPPRAPKPAPAPPLPAGEQPLAEPAPAEPEAAPQVIGRYSAGGDKYVVFSDGAIEAETADGGLRFASMDEFKAYVANRKR